MARGEAASRCGLAAFVVVFSASTASVAEAQVTGKEHDKLPPAFVDRSLVLPRLWLLGELDASIIHLERDFTYSTIELNGGWVDLGGAIGVTDDLELEATVASVNAGEIGYSPIGFYVLKPLNRPFREEESRSVDWGMAKFGATFRFLAADAAEMGLRFRVLVDNEPTVGLNGAIPVLLHGNGVARIDTGVSFVGRVPMGSDPILGTSANENSLGLVDVNQNPMAPDAGIPVRVAVQAIEQLWFGLNTGFGAFDVTLSETIFVPLGGSVGTTIAVEGAVFDLVGVFNFPEFLLPTAAGSDDQIGSELWQVGLTFKAHAGLK
jgi:hypothetical protein